jgi:hypothetical protein
MCLIERDWLKPGLYSHGAAQAEGMGVLAKCGDAEGDALSMGTAPGASVRGDCRRFGFGRRIFQGQRDMREFLQLAAEIGPVVGA